MVKLAPIAHVDLNTRIADKKEKVRQGEIPAETTTLSAEKNPEKIMLFSNVAVAKQVESQPTKFSKPIQTTTEAAAISSVPQNSSIWNNNGHTNFAQNIGSFLSGGTTLASALKDPENNQGSNSDKKEGKNTFLSASKSILDVRKEQLDDNVLSIMGGIC